MMMSKTRMLMMVTLEARTVMMVTLEASVMMKTGDASSWKGFKLSWTHQVGTKMEHG